MEKYTKYAISALSALLGAGVGYVLARKRLDSYVPKVLDEKLISIAGNATGNRDLGRGVNGAYNFGSLDSRLMKKLPPY